MSDLEKPNGAAFLTRFALQRHLRVVESGQDGEPETQPPVLPPALLPSRALTRQERPELSFDRFRRTRSQESSPEVGKGQPLPAFPAPYQSQETACPKCKGIGFTRPDVPYGHPAFGKPEVCSCRVKQRASLFGGAHIPEAFQDRSFESYLQ